MKIRLVRRGPDEFQVYAEVASGKGKKVTTGNKVSKADLKEETARVINEARGSVGTGTY